MSGSLVGWEDPCLVQDFSAAEGIRAEEYCRTEANKVMVAGMDKGEGGGLNRGDGGCSA